MDNDDPFYCKTTFYVRRERTMVLASVGRRVGGPGSSLWAGGWTLGIDSGALAVHPLQDVPWALSTAFCTGQDMRVMTPESKAAWMRTWSNR